MIVAEEFTESTTTSKALEFYKGFNETDKLCFREWLKKIINEEIKDIEARELKEHAWGLKDYDPSPFHRNSHEENEKRFENYIKFLELFKEDMKGL